MRVLTRRWFGSAAGEPLVASTLAAQEHSYTQAGIVAPDLSDIGAFLRMSVRRAPRERCQTEGVS
jgi:hypothetical protein